MIEESVEINAGVGKVWEIFIDLSGWSSWNSVLTIVPPAERNRITKGTRFSCLMRLYSFEVNLEPYAAEVLLREKIVLTGAKFGLRARHEFLFGEKAGKTTVASKEFFAGLPPVLPGWICLQRRIRKLTAQMLCDLKHAVEVNQAENEKAPCE